MPDGKIYITISDEPLGKGKSELGENTEQKDEKHNALSTYAEHEFMHLINSTSQQVVNATINNIGFLTGNYTSQRHIQEALRLAGMVKGIGMSAIAGYKIAGATGGAFIGGGVALIGTMISLGVSDINAYIETKRQNVEIDRLREISGLNNRTNGSR